MLGCTAIVAGVFATGLLVAPGTAFAAGDPSCDVTSNVYDCYGIGDDAVTISPDGDFSVDIGNSAPFVNTTPYAPGSAAFTINANDHNTISDGIVLYPGTFIDAETGIGMSIFAPGNVDLHIRGAAGEDGAASIIGYTHGLSIVGSTEDGPTTTMHVDNHGHVQGLHGNGIDVDGSSNQTLAFNLDNHSYQSIIGDQNGVDIHSGLVSTQINNGGGLIAGINEDGVNISNVSRDSEDAAVNINNGGVGIILGQGNGINISSNVANTGGGAAVNINNNAYYDVVDGAAHFNDGGLIYGDDYAGISIGSEGSDGIYGNVNINNGGTRGVFRDPLTLGLDSAVFDPTFTSDEPLINSLVEASPISPMMPLGIYGQEVGVYVSGATGNVSINNSAHSQHTAYGSEESDNITGINDNSVGGAIIGGGYGVLIGGGGFGVGGAVDINNSNNDRFVDGDMGGTGGFIGGLTEDGVNITHASGSMHVDNNGGTIYGAYRGVYLADTSSGAEIDNAAGRIIGWDGAAAYIDDVDQANVYNGSFDDSGASHGGQIIGHEQALYLGGYDNYVGNGPGGAIIGSGYQNSDDFSDSEAVIEFYSDGGYGHSSVENYGLIAGYGYTEDGETYLPHFNWNSPYHISFNGTSVEEDPGYSLDVAAIASDVNAFGSFAWSGGQAGSLDNNGTSLADYGRASQQLAIMSSGDADVSGPFSGELGGGADVNNEAGGILMGRVEMFSAGGGEDGDSSINNFGTWYVSDAVFDPETLIGGDAGLPAVGMFNANGSSNINNAGLVQTAFSSDDQERATFYVGAFSNGMYYTTGEDGGPATAPGLISAIDGGVGDAIVIAGSSGSEDGGAEFYTSPNGDLGSFVGLDVNLGPGTGEFDIADDHPVTDDWDAAGTWRSDRFYVDGAISGSTGLILNKIGSGTTNAIGDTIIVAHANYVDTESEEGCADFACKAGDTLYIASQSAGYTEVDGTGVVQDGLYGWYLHSGGTVPDPDYVLVSGWAPADVHLPALTTGAQNVFYDTAGQVEDHIYGEHFPAAGDGGSGADLPVGEPPVEAPVQAAGTPAVWAKISGDHFSRDTTVANTIAGVTTNFDTSLVQNTFALLGGADFQPNGAGNDGLRAGVFGAYINSALGFTSYGASASYTGGSFGAYAAYTNDGFYVDGEAKVDLLDMTYTSGGLSSDALAATFGVLANAGYRMQLGSNFVEPIVSAAYADTTIQDLTMGGASVAFSNGQSFRVGIGGKVGTEIALSDEMSAEFALTGKVWNEFGPANSVTVSDGLGNSDTFGDGISGLFGEIEASATIQNEDKSLSGFVSVGDKFNASFNSLNGKAGLRKSF